MIRVRLAGGLVIAAASLLATGCQNKLHDDNMALHDQNNKLQADLNDTPLSACTPEKDFVMAVSWRSGLTGEASIGQFGSGWREGCFRSFGGFPGVCSRRAKWGAYRFERTSRSYALTTSNHAGPTGTPCRRQ